MLRQSLPLLLKSYMQNKVNILQKIGLGTAQFGSAYGIANQRGKIPESEIGEILQWAKAQQISVLDTAGSYGDSEDILGRLLNKSPLNYKIVSKASDLNGEKTALRESLKKTMERLKQKSIYGYLIHNFENLLEQESLPDDLRQLKQEGLVQKIGFSLYRPQELEYLLDHQIRFDIIQIPYNILDQRFEPYLPLLVERNVEIHTRSVFLQGLFFLNSQEIKGTLSAAEPQLKKLWHISTQANIPIVYVCLCFVMLNPFIDHVIIGIDSMEQLRQNLRCLDYMDQVKSVYQELKSLCVDNEDILLPFRWYKQAPNPGTIGINGKL